MKRARCGTHEVQEVKLSRRFSSVRVGLTLLETLVAVAIFMVIMTAIMGMFPSVFKLNRQTRADQSTTIAAKAFMEDMRVHLANTANFDASTPLAVPDSKDMNGYTCQSVMNNTESGTTTSGTSVPLIKRVTLTCTQTGEPTLEYSQDFGRPTFPLLAPGSSMGGS